MLKKITAAVVASLWMGMALSAEASTVSFSNDNFPPELGGTLTFSTTPGGILTVSNAVISSVVNTDTSVGSVVDNTATVSCGITVSFGCLNFTTGTLLSVDPATQTALYSPVGSTLSITGDATSVVGDGVLLYASSFFDEIQIQLFGTTATVQGTLVGGLLDPALAAYLGVLPTPLGGNANTTAINVTLTFNTTGGVTGGSGLISLSDVVLTTVDTPQDVVPEPGSLLLLGTGLFGAAASVRRRLRGRR